MAKKTKPLTKNDSRTKEMSIDLIQNLHLKEIDYLKSLDLLLTREIQFMESLKKQVSKKLNEDSINLYEEVQEFEKNLIQIALVKAGGKQTNAAKLLALKTTTINVKIKRYKIETGNL